MTAKNMAVVPAGCMARVLAGVLPRALAEEPGYAKQVAHCLFVGLLVRLLCLPFAFHVDMLSSYHRACLLLFDGDWRWLAPQQILHALWLLVVYPLIPLQDLLGWSGSYTGDRWAWAQAAEHAHICRAVFLLKLPYLACDIGVALLLLRLAGGGAAGSLAALRVWFLNPVVIFSAYLVGRYDVVAVLCVLLGLAALRWNRPFAGLAMLALAVWFRAYAAMLYPFAIVFHRRAWRSLAVWAGIAASALGVLVCGWFACRHITCGSELPAVAGRALSPFLQFLLFLKLPAGMGLSLYLFVLLYGILLLHAALTPPADAPHRTLVLFSSAVLQIFFATCYFNPHYFSWFIPFLALQYSERREPALMNLHTIQVGVWMGYTLWWGPSMSTWLLAPLAPVHIFAVPGPMELIDSMLPADVVASLFRTALSAACAYGAGLALLDARRRGVP